MTRDDVVSTKAFGLSRGESDPVTYACTCEAGENGGTVVLFYRYWDNNPRLPEELKQLACQPNDLAEWHRGLCTKYRLGGKLRIAREGFNVTVAGTKVDIESYMKECCDHWSFSGLDVNTNDAKEKFFKPSDGCACVFNNIASVRVTAEITPMGIEGYLPHKWDNIEALSPAEFHQRCHEDSTILLDARNHYESKIGYFIDPRTGEPAIRPPIRRFSQWPHYILQHGKDVANERKQIMTYCTGGIRCEKAARWMQESLSRSSETKIYTLDGGIAAYLAWMEAEIRDGRLRPEDSLFKGRNYVFDARGSVGLPDATEVVSRCHLCEQPTSSLTKCHSKGCHLVLVACSDCSQKDLNCCEDCKGIDEQKESRMDGPRSICACEKEREFALWGGVRQKQTKKKKRERKEKQGPDRPVHVETEAVQALA